VGFFGHLFSFFRRKSLPDHIEDHLEERRLHPRVNPKEGTRVLVIDDSLTILTAMKRFLESAHCVFLGALDAKMGMEAALTKKPDLIFLDIVMPGINGFAALRALRKNSRTRETPIIMMSGNEQAKAQFFGAHIGADDFMKKPFSRFEVFGRIARLLDTDRIPRRLSSTGPSAQDSKEELPQAEIEKLPAPPSAAPSEETDQAAAVAATPDEPPEPVLTVVQIVESPVPEPVAQQPAPADAVPADTTEESAAPLAPPSPAPTPPVSAQVVPITQPSAQAPHSGVSPELLTRIARVAQLAQSDPEALKTLVALSAQLATQYMATVGATVSQEEKKKPEKHKPVTQARARAT